CFVVVDNSYFTTDDLCKPDCGGVTDTEIPCSIDSTCWFIRHPRYPLVGLRRSHQLAVVRTDDRGIERAFELLGVFFFALFRPLLGEFFRRQQASIARLEDYRIPVGRVGLGSFVEFVEIISPLWGSDEHSPARSVCKSRRYDLGP